MDRTDSKSNLLEIIFVGFGLSLILIGVIFILLNELPFGLLCLGIGIVAFYLLLQKPIDFQKKDELEIKEIDHALAMSRSIQRGDSGGHL